MRYATVESRLSQDIDTCSARSGAGSTWSASRRTWQGARTGIERIADGFEHDPAMPLNRLPENRIVAGKGGLHRFRMLLPARGAALDVGKEEGNGTGR